MTERAKMQRVVTNDGKVLSVGEGVGATTIEILKSAQVFDYSEFVYTGNSPKGENHDNGAQEAFLRAAGLWNDDDTEESWLDNTALVYYLDSTTGVNTLKWRNKTLRYHAQMRNGERHGQFGYTWRCEYRIISVS